LQILYLKTGKKKRRTAFIYLPIADSEVVLVSEQNIAG